MSNLEIERLKDYYPKAKSSAQSFIREINQPEKATRPFIETESGKIFQVAPGSIIRDDIIGFDKYPDRDETTQQGITYQFGFTPEGGMIILWFVTENMDLHIYPLVSTKLTDEIRYLVWVMNLEINK